MSPTDEDASFGRFTTTTGKSVELGKPGREVCINKWKCERKKMDHENNVNYLTSA